MRPSDLRETAPAVLASHDQRRDEVSALLAHVGDKWTVCVVRVLGQGSLRFNALRRQVGGVSQKMLSTTLRNLERDGFVTRSVTPTAPPQVNYALTDLGRSLEDMVCGLARWTAANAGRIEAARRAYDARSGVDAGPLHGAATRAFSGA
jgi:DNA-binding HxlR family transcriptional regulator